MGLLVAGLGVGLGLLSVIVHRSHQQPYAPQHQLWVNVICIHYADAICIIIIGCSELYGSVSVWATTAAEINEVHVRVSIGF